MPTSSSTGTQPAPISLAKPCPSRWQVNGRAACSDPRARTAVPITLNSRQLDWPTNGAMVSAAATTPSPPSALHSADIRSSAVRRARSNTSTSAREGAPAPETATGASTGVAVPEAVARPGEQAVVVAPVPAVAPDVEDRGAHHLADRLEAGRADRRELPGERGRPGPALPGSEPHPPRSLPPRRSRARLRRPDGTDICPRSPAEPMSGALSIPRFHAVCEPVQQTVALVGCWLAAADGAPGDTRRPAATPRGQTGANQKSLPKHDHNRRIAATPPRSPGRVADRQHPRRDAQAARTIGACTRS